MNMLQDAKRSGLTPADAGRLGFRPLTKSKVQKLGFTQFPAAGYLIPYFDALGRKTDFFRFRYLEQPARNGFDALVNAKPLRYIQPAGVPPRVYFPPGFKMGDDNRLYITEGEKKAAKAVKEGYNAIGLGGVWTFLADGKLLPELEALPWAKLTVFIVYDAGTNPDVTAARNRLARMLLDRKADVWFIDLPAELGEKVGWDDYLVAEGAVAFNALEPAQFSASAELHRLNEEVLYIEDQDVVYEPEAKLRHDVGKFQSHSRFAPRTYSIITSNKGRYAGQPIQKSAAKAWVLWAGRRRAARMVYEPGLITVDDYNTWVGWGVEECAGSLELWNKLLTFIIPDAKARTWFERWLAYPIQYPGEKLYTAVLVWSRKQGNGKTLIGETVGRLYGDNYSLLTDKQLDSDFNEWAVNKQFIMGDEIGAAPGESKRRAYDRNKGLITQERVTINKKFLPTYSVRDCMNFYFNSNSPDSFYLAEEDRRFFIIEAPDAVLPDAFYEKYRVWFRSPAVGALLHYLRRLDLGDFNPHAAALVTEAKTEAIALGRSAAEEFAYQLRHNPDMVLLAGGAVMPQDVFDFKQICTLFQANGPTLRKQDRDWLARALTTQKFEKWQSNNRKLGRPWLYSLRGESKTLVEAKKVYVPDKCKF